MVFTHTALKTSCLKPFRHELAGGVFYYGHRAVELVEAEDLIELHGFSRGDVVDDDAVLNRVNDHCVALPFSLDFQQLEDQRHADVLAVLHLLEVAGTGVLIHRHRDLIDTG